MTLLVAATRRASGTDHNDGAGAERLTTCAHVAAVIIRFNFVILYVPTLSLRVEKSAQNAIL